MAERKISSMNLQFVLMQLFNGLILGSALRAFGVGTVDYFRDARDNKFCPWRIFYAGAYAAYTITAYIIPDFWLALVCVPLLMVIFGAFCEVVLFERLYNLPPLYIMLLTFGLMLVLQDAVRLVFGSMGVPFSTPHSLTGMVNLGFMVLSQLSTFSNRW